MQDAEAATRALLAVLAWGFGTRGYGPYRVRRILGPATSPPRLVRVASALATGVLPAYEAMATWRDSRIAFLGPAFGTKYLYFCQPEASDPRALILDRFVADWLAHWTELRLDPWTWSTASYGSYLNQMNAWAAEAGCEPDDLERLMFDATNRRASSWVARPH